MLVLKRKEGQWVELIHRSGDAIRLRVYDIAAGAANVAFDDDARNFEIKRPERGNVAPEALEARARGLASARAPMPVAGERPDAAIATYPRHYREARADIEASLIEADAIARGLIDGVNAEPMGPRPCRITPVDDDGPDPGDFAVS